MISSQHPFKYVQPDEDQVRRMQVISELFAAAYDEIITTVPANAERTLAVRSLQLARFWTNVAILGIEVQTR